MCFAWLLKSGFVKVEHPWISNQSYEYFLLTQHICFLLFLFCRDLQDVGAKKIKVYSLNKVLHLYTNCFTYAPNIIFLFQFHYGKISGKRNGRVRKGVIFTTYSSLIGESASGGKYRTRLNQLLHWLGSQFDGVVSFPCLRTVVFPLCYYLGVVCK